MLDEKIAAQRNEKSNYYSNKNQVTIKRSNVRF